MRAPLAYYAIFRDMLCCFHSRRAMLGEGFILVVVQRGRVKRADVVG